MMILPEVPGGCPGVSIESSAGQEEAAVDDTDSRGGREPNPDGSKNWPS